jgi:hypothetical protein
VSGWNFTQKLIMENTRQLDFLTEVSFMHWQSFCNCDQIVHVLFSSREMRFDKGSTIRSWDICWSSPATNWLSHIRIFASQYHCLPRWAWLSNWMLLIPGMNVIALHMVLILESMGSGLRETDGEEGDRCNFFNEIVAMIVWRSLFFRLQSKVLYFWMTQTMRLMIWKLLNRVSLSNESARTFYIPSSTTRQCPEFPVNVRNRSFHIFSDMTSMPLDASVEIIDKKSFADCCFLVSVATDNLSVLSDFISIFLRNFDDFNPYFRSLWEHWWSILQ